MLDNTERVERSGRQLEEGYKMCVETGKAIVDMNIGFYLWCCLSLSFHAVYQSLHFTFQFSNFTPRTLHFTFHISQFVSQTLTILGFTLNISCFTFYT